MKSRANQNRKREKPRCQRRPRNKMAWTKIPRAKTKNRKPTEKVTTNGLGLKKISSIASGRGMLQKTVSHKSILGNNTKKTEDDSEDVVKTRSAR